MKIGIKIGSKLLVNKKGKTSLKLIYSISKQIFNLKKEGHSLVLVSSGAVASEHNKSLSKNLRAAMGQIKLMFYYYFFFTMVHRIKIAQMLLTDDDLINNRNETTKKVLLECFEKDVLPIINGNDVVDDAELKALDKCEDNDILFSHVCKLAAVDRAVISFSEDGVKDLNNNLIKIVKLSQKDEVLKYANGGNEFGHGLNGMKTKMMVCFDLTENGIETVLAPGFRKDYISRSLSTNNHLGTKFIND